jgi:hypothetical protein
MMMETETVTETPDVSSVSLFLSVGEDYCSVFHRRYILILLYAQIYSFMLNWEIVGVSVHAASGSMMHKEL